MPKSAVEMLERSHRRLEERMAELVAALAGPVGDAERETIAEVKRFMSRSVRNHVADEEDSIFPRLEGADELVAQLRHEHEEHERLTRELEHELNEVLENASEPARHRAHKLATVLDAAYRSHTELEDAKLLPLVEAMPDATKDAAGREMQARRNDKSGAKGGKSG